MDSTAEWGQNTPLAEGTGSLPFTVGRIVTTWSVTKRLTAGSLSWSLSNLSNLVPLCLPQGAEQEPYTSGGRSHLPESVQPGGAQAAEEQHQQADRWSLLGPGQYEDTVRWKNTSLGYIWNIMYQCLRKLLFIPASAQFHWLEFFVVPAVRILIGQLFAISILLFFLLLYCIFPLSVECNYLLICLSVC